MGELLISVSVWDDPCFASWFLLFCNTVRFVYLYVESLFMNTAKPANIDGYIASFPKATQEILQQVRATIQKAAPEAVEKISYAMPTFYLQGNLVHFAAYEHHIGFYATPSAGTNFTKELSKYKQGKGSIQFPIDEPMPLSLITKIVKFRVKENMEKAALKKKK